MLTGQMLCVPATDYTMVHASISGLVSEIKDNVVTIENDGQDQPFNYSLVPPNNTDDFESLCRQMGLVGLGGAIFPVHKKLNAARSTPIDTLLVNAAECDPDIYCDEALMHLHASEIAQGIALVQKHSNAARCIVGIEDNKTEAINQLRQHLSDDIKIITVPAIYPSGAENTLLELCTGKKGGLRANQSLCFNVATCYAIYRAVKQKQPLISRIVTVVTDNAIHNYNIRIGTPISDITHLLSISSDTEIIHGGRMMGTTVTHDSIIKKSSNSIIFRTPENKNSVPCIRCGACVDVCPENLAPHHLHWHARTHNSSALTDLKLDQCIECACCDLVCPSHIKLADQFTRAKELIQQEQSAQQKAILAKQRYESRLTRLDKQSARERMKLDRKSTTLSKPADPEKNPDQVKKDLIAKALKRSKTKKRSNDQQSHD